MKDGLFPQRGFAFFAGVYESPGRRFAHSDLLQIVGFDVVEVTQSRHLQLVTQFRKKLLQLHFLHSINVDPNG